MLYVFLNFSKQILFLCDFNVILIDLKSNFSQFLISKNRRKKRQNADTNDDNELYPWHHSDGTWTRDSHHSEYGVHSFLGSF